MILHYFLVSNQLPLFVCKNLSKKSFNCNLNYFVPNMDSELTRETYKRYKKIQISQGDGCPYGVHTTTNEFDHTVF